MRCDELSDRLSPYLDGALPQADAESVGAHLATCADCARQLDELRQVDGQLRSHLVPPNVEDFVARLQTQIGFPPPRRAKSSTPSSRGAGWLGLLFAAGLLVAVAIGLRAGRKVTPIASASGSTRLVRATGPVEVISPSGKRTSLIPDRPVVLTDGARVRTGPDALCELETGCQGIVRMDTGTELVVHPLERVELVEGQVWAQAARQCELGIQLGTRSGVAPRLSVFQCPTSSELQWSVKTDAVSCTALTDHALALETSASAIQIPPESCVEIVGGKPAERSRKMDPLAATRWQLPLLVMKTPQDSELQARLDAVLATIGETKLGYVYEEDLLKLGPAGAEPLLAYIRSDRSKENPERRRRAMRIAGRMVWKGQISDLADLAGDGDPEIRRIVRETVERLQGIGTSKAATDR